MLDINGKTLLQRNVETLNIVGIQDISIVVGYKADRVELEGAKIIKNEDFKTKGIMHSIVKGIDTVGDKNLILYSDIIFDQNLLQNLLKKEGDIILVVDGTYKKTHSRNKKLELVAAKFAHMGNERLIDVNKKNPILKIGSALTEEKAHYEFIGLALLSRKGMEMLIKEYRAAKTAADISFADFIQRLIDKGAEVLAHTVMSGWMEIHNFTDYKKASSLFS